MTIYLITNNLNGKQYVGQTKSTLPRRFNQHCEKRNQTAISHAIKKYGRENFSIRPICENVGSLEELNELEKRYIKDFDTLCPNGYNIESGGSTPMSEQTKSKISKANKGRSILWKDKISKGVGELWKDEVYREQQTKQRCQKRGNYRKGIVRHKLRKSIDLKSFKEDYLNYMKISEIVKKYKISQHTIYRIIEREGIEKRGYNNKNNSQ